MMEILAVCRTNLKRLKKQTNMETRHFSPAVEPEAIGKKT